MRNSSSCAKRYTFSKVNSLNPNTLEPSRSQLCTHFLLRLDEQSKLTASYQWPLLHPSSLIFLLYTFNESSYITPQNHGDVFLSNCCASNCRRIVSRNWGIAALNEPPDWTEESFEPSGWICYFFRRSYQTCRDWRKSESESCWWNPQRFIRKNFKLQQLAVDFHYKIQ